MARFKAGEGFRNLVQGEDQLLTITSATLDTKTMVAKLRFEDGQGRSGTETYRLGKAKVKSAAQTGALNALTTVAKTALRNWDLEEIDTDDLVGRRVIADVVAQTTDDGRTFVHPRNWREVEEDEPFEGYEDDGELFG